MQNDLPYWLALNEFPKFGPRSMAKIMARFDSMETAFKASVKDLMLAGISEKTALEFCHLREQINPLQIWRNMKRLEFDALTIKDENYPPLLKQIYDPPAVLYLWGKVPKNEIAHVAIVGSRKATPYGLRAAADLARDIALSGVVVVSGLAYGIDQAAHLATVAAGGLTVAVLASGFQTLSSRQRYVAQKIVGSGGAVVSEFPLTTQGLPHNFPIRNRIISGLSQGTIIIEATEKSGSLITAQSALEQNREVFALPGPITSETSYGTNNLIKMGAHLVTQASDVLDVLQVAHVQEKVLPPKPADSKEEAMILELLSKSPIHIDEIIRSTQLDGSKVAGTLSLMEMKGRARQIGGMYYILT